MGTIHIKEMTGGLDARRLPETTPGGVLLRAENGHITRGGEFEARAAFVPEFELPAGETIGLAHNRTGLVVFGAGPRPPGVPSFVRYQRLQKGEKVLAAIRDWELFAGKIYAVAEFDDGTIVHFLDGVEVAAWQDARASVVLQILSGAIEEAESASAEVQVTGGTGEIINRIERLLVSGTEMIRTPIVHTGDNGTTAQAIVDEINANPMSPGYTATRAGATITITATRAGVGANGRTITWETTGDFTMGGATVFAGGTDEVVPTIDTVQIDGVNILRQPVEWAGSTDATARAVADAIVDLASDPEYEAIAIDNRVVVKSTIEGTAQNGLVLAVTTSGTIAYDTPGGAALSGGAALAADTYLPAEVILTVQEKMYSGAGTILHYSAVGNPEYWAPGGTDPGEIGAGFTNVAESNSSAYRITSLGRYFDKLAVFTPDTVQTWFIDPNPDLVTQSQVLENTGTECPRSVTQFGDADIFYLDTSGLRSLRARDSSNAAATTDVGVPIDDILTAILAGMSAAEKRKVIGLINPGDKRFWLTMGDKIFVYSYYPSSKVNAWTRYAATTTEGEATETLDISEAVTFDRHVFVRSGDTIYCYGGWGKVPIYDDTPATARIPMLDANSPTGEKQWTGIDAALSGEWDATVAFDPRNPEARQDVAVLTGTTFGERRIPVKHRSTHIDIELTSRGGPAVLSALVIHFDGKVDED